MLPPQLESILLPKHTQVRILGGLRLNYPPHIGTYFFLACCFSIAAQIRSRSGLFVEIALHGLDNAPLEVIGNTWNGLRRPLYAMKSRVEIEDFFQNHYGMFLAGISAMCDIPWKVQCYSEFQAQPEFRQEFLGTLKFREMLNPCISAFHSVLNPASVVGVRFPCPHCGLSSFYGQETELLAASESEAQFRSQCSTHGDFTATITAAAGVLIDLQKLYRNIIKESILQSDPETLHIVAKGADWRLSSEWVDRGLAVLKKKPAFRIYFPIIFGGSNKLSKSAIAQTPSSFNALPPWVVSPSQIDPTVLLHAAKTVLLEKEWRDMTIEELARHLRIPW